MWQDSRLQVVRLAVLLGDLVLAPPAMFLMAVEWVAFARLLAGTQVLSMSPESVIFGITGKYELNVAVLDANAVQCWNV